MSSEDRVQYQMRRESLSSHEIICRTPRSIYLPFLDQNELEILDEYTQKYNYFCWLQQRRYGLPKLATSASPNLAKEIESQLKELDTKITAYYNELNNFKVRYPSTMKKLLEIGQSELDKQQREETQRILDEWRKKRDMKFDNEIQVPEITAQDEMTKTDHSISEPHIVMASDNKPSFIRAIITSIISFVLFYLSYIIAYLILGSIIQLLSILPLIGDLLRWFFTLRGDTPDMMLSILVPTISYFIIMLIQEARIKHKKTRGLSYKILGVMLATVNVLSLLVNLIYRDPILKNIIQIIVGIIFFSSGKRLVNNNDDG